MRSPAILHVKYPVPRGPNVVGLEQPPGFQSEVGEFRLEGWMINLLEGKALECCGTPNAPALTKAASSATVRTCSSAYPRNRVAQKPWRGLDPSMKLRAANQRLLVERTQEAT